MAGVALPLVMATQAQDAPWPSYPARAAALKPVASRGYPGNPVGLVGYATLRIQTADICDVAAEGLQDQALDCCHYHIASWNASVPPL